MSSSIRQLWERLLSMFRKRKLDDDLSEELAAHIEMATEDNVRAGMNPQEARRQAMIRFGGVEAAKELHRDARSLPSLESFVQDARYALRMLGRNPGFALTAVLVLALGLAAVAGLVWALTKPARSLVMRVLIMAVIVVSCSSRCHFCCPLNRSRSVASRRPRSPLSKH